MEKSAFLDLKDQIITLSVIFIQEVGSIIGKKGDNVKRYREEVSLQPRFLCPLAYFLMLSLTFSAMVVYMVIS